VLEPFVDAAIAACREAAALIASSEDGEGYRAHSRGAGGDISIGFDLLAEAVFVRYLRPFGTILSEESGTIEGEGDALIILDPVDGSDNLKSCFPYYGASIALQRHGRTEAAVISNFANGDCFVKYHDRHYQTSLFDPDMYRSVTIHPHAKIGLFEKSPDYCSHAEALMQEGLKFRSPGAVALSLAYAHVVNYVLFMGPMRPYDLDAGLFMCESLHVFKDAERLVVAKDKRVFDTLLGIFLKG